jgi:hypothetical protein
MANRELAFPFALRVRNAFKKATTVEIDPGDVGSATMLEKFDMHY